MKYFFNNEDIPKDQKKKICNDNQQNLEIL